MITHYFKLVLAASLLTAFTAHTNAKTNNYYQWQDANGVTKFSDKKPVARQNVQQKSVRTHAPTRLASQPNSNTSGKSAKNAPNSEAMSKENKQLKEQVNKQNEQARKQTCQALETSMNNLSVGGKIYEMKDGKRNYLSGKEIEQRRIKVRDKYMKNCAK